MQKVRSQYQSKKNADSLKFIRILAMRFHFARDKKLRSDIMGSKTIDTEPTQQ